MPIDLRQFITKQEEEKQEPPKETFHPGKSNVILHQWQGPEFEVYEKSQKWYIYAAMFLMVIIAYAMVNNGPIMAITFILVGIVGYIHLQKEPRTVNFTITTDGIIADKDMYLFENIFSFWIFYEEDHKRVISLHTKAAMFPFIHIPLHDEDPVAIREIMLDFIPEIKQEPSIIDGIERVLHI